MHKTPVPFKWMSRSLLVALALLSPFPGGISVGAGDDKKPQARVRFEDVVERARMISQEPFEPASMELPEVLQKMGYDQWRGIRFKPGRALWRDEAYSVQFFHPGFLYKQPVGFNRIERKGVVPVSFSMDLFEYETPGLESQLSEDYGFAGFRVHYPLNTPDYADELVSFLGASYFRALGKGQVYGMSARGLAVNTARDDGEEFPFFREFWVVRPVPGSKSITIYALLDSESLSGAYEFEVHPGEQTSVKVRSRLFIRKSVDKIGVAPLTSMFFYAENSFLKTDADFRPEVHDSDGLLVHAPSGEWIWHPLVNPSRLLINAFGGGQPHGFGLMQRDVNFDHYQDLEARYDRRPSVWVSPQGDWGQGYLELIQLPTSSEYNDNIVLYWVPERPFGPGDSVGYDYTLSWYSAWFRRSSLAFAESTRIVKQKDGVMFVIDFKGEEFTASLANRTLVPDVWASKGAVIGSSQLISNSVTGGWRLVLHVKFDRSGFVEKVLPGQRPAIEFRAFLKDGQVPVTETWSYTYLP
jgi:glucans biosynthesis protein